MKQTAMQMAIDHYKKLSEQGSNQAYVVAKFLEENFLAMEKEQKGYSKEEVDNLLNKLLENNMCSHAGDELIEQFKNN